VTSFYLHENKLRTTEMLTCLYKNAVSKNINNIHIFIEDENSVIFLKKQFESFGENLKKKLKIIIWFLV
jgi:hypothetical protein